MAAVAFNMGMTSKPDRDDDTIKQLSDACKRLGQACGLDINDIR
jgi:hypothetical protein